MGRDGAKRIRLCQITPSIHGGGIETRTSRLLGALPRDEFSIAWAGFGPAHPSLVERAGKDVEVFSLEKRAAGVDVACVWQIASLLRRWQPDVVHVHNWSASLYGIMGARLAGVPHVLYGLGGRDTIEPPSTRRLLAMRALAPWVDRFSTVCDFLRDEISHEWKVPRSRVTVIRTGVDLARFDSTDKRASARARVGLPPGAVAFGTAGVLRSVKRLEDFIEAAARIAAHHPEAHFVLLGFEGAEDTSWIQSAFPTEEMRSRLHVLGRVQDVENVLPALDVFVSCSRFEGSSNAIIEAMAVGLPVIATRVGGTPELVRDGDNGILFERENVEQLVDAMDRLIRAPDERRAFGVRSAQRARHDHSLERMTLSYADLYRQIVGEAPHSASWARLAPLVRLVKRT